MYCVYQHIRLDNNQVFYIGIGKPKRPYEKNDRNQHWHNVVKKHGYMVDVLISGIDWHSACSWERYLIELHGRNDLVGGPLVNLTNGGDGRHGSYPSAESRLKMSKSHKGKKLPGTAAAMKLRCGNNHPFYKRFGGDHPSAEPIVDINTGEIKYLSATEAAKGIGMKYSTLKAKLQGVNSNNTGLAYFKKYTSLL